jgi:hypothetical protein
MRACLPAVRCFAPSLGVWILCLLPVPLWAQGQLGTEDGLKKAFKDTTARRNKLVNGDEQPGKADKTVAEATANYYLHRLTHVADTVAMEKMHKEFNAAIDSAMDKQKTKNNRAYIDQYFGPALVVSMKEVLARDVKNNQTIVINAAMMLPSMAKLKQDSISDYLIALVEDKATHDVVRLFALKALKETLPVTIQQDNVYLDFTDKAQNAKRVRDAKNVNALTAYVERSVGVTGLSPEQVAALVYLRREAIISLANAGAPAVLAVNKRQVKKDVLEGVAAPTLLKVLAGGEMQPAPSLQEKVEAALGLCAMKHPNMSEYDPSLAAYLIGRTIQEFLDDYNKDLGNITAAGAGKKLPIIAYRTDAKRLSDGLTEFAKNANIKAATDLKVLAQPILVSMTPAGYPRTDNAKVNELRLQLPQFQPKTNSAFKTLKAPVVPLN